MLIMTSTEEIVVIGADFIERRILVGPSPEELEEVQRAAHRRGYKLGWMRGFLTGMAVFVFVAVCLWLVLQS
jgi:hypothetical protein